MDATNSWLKPAVLESISDGFVFLDREMRYVYVNEAAERLLLRTRDELIGRHVWDVFPQPPGSPFREPTDRAMATGQPTHVQGLNVRRGVWFDCHNYPSEEGLTIIFRDISEQKRSEAALRASEARFRTMADAAPVLIWMAGMDMGRHFFNKTWLDFTGRPLEQETGNGWAEGVHPDDLDRCFGTYPAAFEQREAFTMEYRLRRADGAYRWMLDQGVPLYDGRGEFTGYIGSCIDIHERRRVKEQLAFLSEASSLLASSLDYEETLRHVGQLMVPRLADWCAVDVYNEAGELERVTIAHVDPEQVAWVMEAARRYPSDPNRPHNVARVARDGVPVLVPHVTDDLLVANAKDEEQLQFLRRIGFRSMMIVPLKSRDTSLGAIVMVWAESGNTYSESDLHFAQELAARAAVAIENARLFRQAREAERRLKALNESLEERVRERTTELEEEVAERLRAEQELARVVSQLRERNRELQDFASVASHDLQEPLRKVSTFASLLRDEYAAVMDESGSMYLDRIQDASQRMSALIRDLLAYSRAAVRKDDFEVVDLNEIIEVVLSDLEIRKKEVKGRVLHEALPAIEGDPTQVHQLFQNLISNALKFQRPGVPPVVEVTSTLETNPANESAVCRIEVRDNGIGIEQQWLDEIFLPFRRLHRHGDYSGTGIGLAICRRIVERHGGSITARSTPGEGSVFEVCLPVHHRRPVTEPG